MSRHRLRLATALLSLLAAAGPVPGAAAPASSPPSGAPPAPAAQATAAPAISGAALAAQGLAAYRAGDFAAAAGLFEAAMAAGENGAEMGYSAACSHALAGDRAAALQALDLALDHGFGDAQLLEKDTDLATLRADPGWSARVERARANHRLAVGVFESPAIAGPYAAQLPEETRVAGLAKLWAEVRFGFANFDLVPDLDWDATFAETLPAVRGAASTLDYYRVLQSLVARLRDGHTRVEPPPELIDAWYAAPALRLRAAEGRVLVAEVRDDEAAKNGVRPGCEILTVDGLAVAEHVARRVAPWVSASTPQDLAVRTLEYGLLAGDAAAPVALELACGGAASVPASSRGAVGGARVRASVARVAPHDRQPRMAREAIEVHQLAGGVLQVILRSFEVSAKTAERFRALAPQLATMRALILDVRDNGGGNSGEGDAILGTLVDHQAVVGRWRTRSYRPAFRAWGRTDEAFFEDTASVQPTPGVATFRGPVAVLTSARTYSAAEDFTAHFHALGRGLVVGEATGGSTGQPLEVTLPGGGVVRICSRRDRYPDGSDWVGKGIQPDVPVVVRFADLAGNRDPVLEAAVAAVTKAAR